jgi:hypothetical protein
VRKNRLKKEAWWELLSSNVHWKPWSCLEHKVRLRW